MVSSRRSLLSTFISRPTLTRYEIQELTGLSRVTVSQTVSTLLDEKVLVEQDGQESNGGRKATYLSLNANAGYVGIVYLSATTMTVAISNLAGEIIKSNTGSNDISAGPSKALPQIKSWLEELFKGIPKAKRIGILVGVPGPVSHRTGKVVSPPIMRGWDSIDFYKEFKIDFDIPVYLENDANLMAFAEWRLIYPEVDDLLLIKHGTGVGSGLILNGNLFTGADGAAGDIGHIQLDELGGVDCLCGKVNCVEAASGGGALVAKLKSLGYKVKNTQDLADLARAGDREVIKLIAEAAGYIGKAIADAINLFNPRKIIIEGRIVESTDLYMSTLKEVIYKRAAALATKDLEIVQSKLGNDRALLGAAQLGIEQFFFKSN